MGIIRPATPGFLVTLVATILLAVVSFSVPWFKSVFFLKASLSVEGVSGSVTFGTLGYCLELNNGTTCSSPSIGYEIDVNKLLGNNLSIQIPQVVVKWLTYALFLHVVALILATISAVFGLLAHIREMSMTCFSTCISGFAASIALIAFIFDLAFFFVARSRINAVKGGSASMGNAIWLTLAAWILLFFSGCFFGLGKCCIRRRPRDPWGHDRDTSGAPPAQGVNYADQMRLDAVKAEADRKARQKPSEVGLPAFNEYDDSQPLKAHIDGDAVYAEDDHVPYRDNTAQPIAGGPGRHSSAGGQAFTGGYAQAPVGSRAVDEYYNPSASAYPPQPLRQGSGHTQTPSGYTPSNYRNNNNISSATAPVPTPSPQIPGGLPVNQYLAPSGGAYAHDQYPSNSGREYGHAAGGSTYNSAISGHQQYPSQYHDPYAVQQSRATAPLTLNPETYNNTAAFSAPRHSPPLPLLQLPNQHSSTYYTPPTQPPPRSYTLGGGGYGENTVPALSPADDSASSVYSRESPMTNLPPRLLGSSGFGEFGPQSSSPTTSAPPHVGNTSPVKGPRGQRASVQYDDEPPMYDGPGPSQVWNGGKR